MPNWRDELLEAVKSKAERDAEEQERQRKRVKEALTTAEAAMSLAAGALRFARDKLVEKSQAAELRESQDGYVLALGDLTLSVALQRDAAVLRITYVDGKPRDFDFAKDRHIAPVDVEEYVGRRAVELVRAAQKTAAW